MCENSRNIVPLCVWNPIIFIIESVGECAWKSAQCFRHRRACSKPVAISLRRMLAHRNMQLIQLYFSLIKIEASRSQSVHIIHREQAKGREKKCARKKANKTHASSFMFGLLIEQYAISNHSTDNTYYYYYRHSLLLLPLLVAVDEVIKWTVLIVLQFSIVFID